MRKNQGKSTMKIAKKSVIMVITIIIAIAYLFSFPNVKAASTATVTLTSSATDSSGETTVGAGETFTINVNAQSSDGINMLYGMLSYDTSILELVSRRAPSGWLDSSDTEQGEILVFLNSGSATTSQVTVYTLTFRVKTGTAIGRTARVTISNIGVDTALDTENPTDSRVDIGTKTFSITTGIGVVPTTPEDDPTVDSDHQVEVDNENLTISAIQPRTTVANFRRLIKTNATMVVQTAAGGTVGESTYVATGMKAVFNSTKTYTLIVKGDVDADGDAGQYDMANINAHRLGLRRITDQILFQAGDIYKDDTLDQWDMANINAFRVGQRTVI